MGIAFEGGPSRLKWPVGERSEYLWFININKFYYIEKYGGTVIQFETEASRVNGMANIVKMMLLL